MHRPPTARCSRLEAPGDVTAQERFAVAAFVAGLHGDCGDGGFLRGGSGRRRGLRGPTEGA